MNPNDVLSTSLAILKREKKKRKCKKSYYHFFLEFWPVIEAEKLADNWHIEYLCNELQDIAERVFRREPLEHNLIINISPGETKSTISTIMFPVWCWVNDPTLRIITASYSKDLAMYHATKSRDIIRSDKFQQLFGDEFQVRKDMDAKSVYGNDQGGQRITASVGSTITGKHAHIIIADDPLSSDQAKSDVEREKANDWMGKTLSSRKVDMKLTPTVLVMQRLHEVDPTSEQARKWGKVDQLRWLRLPADDRYKILPPELEDNYTKSGNMRVMNPYRKPEKVIKGMEAEMTATDASGQLGQDPQPAEGNKLKKAWFAQRFSLFELEELARIRGHKIVWNATLDGAYTKITKNSATGVLIWAIYQNKLYLRDYREWHLEFHDLMRELPPFISQYFTTQSTCYVEPKAIGKSLVQVIRNKGLFNIIEDKLPEGITQMQGKELRVDRSTPFIRAMNLWLMDGIDWQPFIDQCATFPNAAHTDLVDTLTMAVEKIDIKDLLTDPDAWGVSRGKARR